MNTSLKYSDFTKARSRSLDFVTHERIGCRAAVSQVELVRWHELDSSQRAILGNLRQSQIDFATPFFSLGFLDAVHQARGDVQVIVLRDECRLLGMLPVHILGKTAYPAGRFLNDAHNVVMAPDTQLNWVWMLKVLGVRSYDFHALAGQVSTHRSVQLQETVQSFSADLSVGSDAFVQKMESEHVTFRRQGQKNRKMEREIGPLSLEIDCRDERLLELAITWKRQQYQRTNILDLFTPTWTRDLMRILHRQDTGGRGASLVDSATRGFLSVLRAGDQVVAMHYGMIENGLLHYWFPTYDPAYSKYSPGTALFKEIASQAEFNGIHAIDMGYGEQPYKRKQTDTITTVRQGCVSGSKSYLAYRRSMKSVSSWAHRMPMKSRLKSLVRSIKPTAGISKIR